ncbi:hypothetical protein H0194_09045 [Corynebacterium incognita]|uniref:Uncharacterized protein n=1 Tax=Corynebacterium incognita TaxID=2754725 RepID=A0A7G7CNM6_9CORY|nr:DUF6350 family protein [Corynebacterium incognita]QNE89192.1 hypothetical protein H0194_09045 [Corynebacterium incognita]
MNRNTSPQTRSSARARARKSSQKLHGTSAPAARIGKKAGAATKARKSAYPTTMAGRIRRMFFTVAIPNIAVLLTIAVIALAVMLLAGSPLAWLPTAIADMWLVANAGGVRADGIDISVVPLVPALGVAAALSSRIHAAVKDRANIKDLLILLCWVVAIPALLFGIAWLMLWDAGKVYDVAPPSFLPTLLRVELLHLSALGIGMGLRLWRALARRYSVPLEAVSGARTALRFLLYMVGAGAVFYLVMMVAGYSRISGMMAQYPNLDGLAVLCLWGLSVLYLPNLAAAAAAVLSGSEAHIGDASISLFSIHLVPLPPLPALGGIPGAAGQWAMVVLVIPAAVAAVVFLREKTSWRHVVATSVFTALFTLVGGFLTTGVVGFYGDTGLSLWLTAGLMAAWPLGVGLAVVGALALTSRRADPTAGITPDTTTDATTEADVAEPAPAEQPEPAPAAEAESVDEEAPVVEETPDEEDTSEPADDATTEAAVDDTVEGAEAEAEAEPEEDGAAEVAAEDTQEDTAEAEPAGEQNPEPK